MDRVGYPSDNNISGLARWRNICSHILVWHMMELAYKTSPHQSCPGNPHGHYRTFLYQHMLYYPNIKKRNVPRVNFSWKNFGYHQFLNSSKQYLTLHNSWLAPQETTFLLHSAGSSSESSFLPLTGSDPQSTSLSQTQSRGIHFWLKLNYSKASLRK